jgi:5-hydroxyisourate hydrolase-like protein (transthyretin family)
MKFSLLFMLVVLLATSVGCGGGGRVPVEGVVTMNGKPLTGATVMLLGSEGSSQERTFRGETDADGKFQISTANGSSNGVPPGEYSVFITSVKIPPGASETTRIPPDPVPVKWRDGSQKYTVPPGGATDANFVISSR